MVVHIWKSAAVLTLICSPAGLAIPARALRGGLGRRCGRLASFPLHHLAVDQHALRHLHPAFDDLHGRDFNSVYLLTGGGPADLTHVLATLASAICGSTGRARHGLDRVALPLILPLVYFMMRRLSR